MPRSWPCWWPAASRRASSPRGVQRPWSRSSVSTAIDLQDRTNVPGTEPGRPNSGQSVPAGTAFFRGCRMAARLPDDPLMETMSVPVPVSVPAAAKMETPPRVLIADDQPDVLEALRLALKGDNFSTECAASPDQILRAVEGKQFD